MLVARIRRNRGEAELKRSEAKASGVDGRRWLFLVSVYKHSLLPRLLPFQRCEAKSNLVKGSNTCRGSNGLQRHFGMNVLWGIFIGILWAVNLGEIVILPPQFAGGTSWTCVHYGCRVRISQKNVCLPLLGVQRIFNTSNHARAIENSSFMKFQHKSCKHSNIKTWCFLLTLDKSKSPWKGGWIRILGTDPLLVVWSSFVDRRPASGFR